MTQKYIDANIHFCNLNLETVNDAIKVVNARHSSYTCREENLKFLNGLKADIERHLAELRSMVPTE